MTKVDIAGLGAWSPTFSDWQALGRGLQTGEWSADVILQPELIPARERRRAPQLVKMAIEVMDQACKMASLDPNDVAVVFSSSMGDMQITDYMCRALAESPQLISPTRFHNSVHNAAPGYWSITTGAFTPATAISAYEYTASMAFLEAAIQAVEEDTPVVLVTQEIAALLPLYDTCPSEQPFSAAFLLTPAGHSESAVCSLEFSVSQQVNQWPTLDGVLGDDYGSNFGARLLPLLAAIATRSAPSTFDFPISATSTLSLALQKIRGSGA
jgi:hypothetical protein